MEFIYGFYAVIGILYNLCITVVNTQWINLVIPIVLLIGIHNALIVLIRVHSVMVENNNDMSLLGKLIVSFSVMTNDDFSKFFHVRMTTKYFLKAYHVIYKYLYPYMNTSLNTSLPRICYNAITMTANNNRPFEIPFPEACCWIDQHHGSTDIVVFFHPGGFLTGNPTQSFMADHMYTHLNKMFYKPVDVLAVDYKKLPRYRYPIAIEETCAIYEQLVTHFPSKRFHFIGASAGGNLALNVIMRAIEKNLTIPKSLVLWSPWIMTARDHPEVLDTISRPLVNVLIKSYYGDHYRTLAHQHGVLQFDYSAFPPALVHYGDEYLEPEIVEFINAFQQSNPRIVARKRPGLSHSYHLLYTFSKTIQQDCMDSYKFMISHFQM